MSLPNPIVLLDARARYVHPAFQMTRASTKTVFDATGKLVTVPVNALGWDHDPATGQARGYLAEPSATNLLLHSNDLTQSEWSKPNSSVTGDAITGPDGQGMAKLVENDAEAEHYLLQSNSGATQPGVPVTGSVIVRAAERENIVLRLTSVATSSNRVQLRFNAAAGQIVATAINGDAVLLGAGSEDLGNGFHRVWVSGTIGATADDPRFVVFLRESSDGWGNIYKGDGTSGLYVGYCQVEEGSYPTSYIETGAATATRVQDSLVLSNLGDFPWWRSERGTLLVDVDAAQFVSNGRILDLGDGKMALRWQNNAERIVLSGGNVSSIVIVRDLGDALGRSIIAFAWDEEEVQPSVGGTLNTPSALSSPLTVTSLGLGSSTIGTLAPHARIHRAVYYPHRISNANLQSLTAMQE